MPADEGGNYQSPREHGANEGQHQGRNGRNQRRHGNRSGEHQRARQPKFEGREPRLQGHVYDWTGERTLSGIYQPHVKSVTMLASPTPNTPPISQLPRTILS